MFGRYLKPFAFMSFAMEPPWIVLVNLTELPHGGRRTRFRLARGWHWMSVVKMITALLNLESWLQMKPVTGPLSNRYT
jgi:hypothetical protein